MAFIEAFEKVAGITSSLKRLVGIKPSARKQMLALEHEKLKKHQSAGDTLFGLHLGDARPEKPLNSLSRKIKLPVGYSTAMKDHEKHFGKKRERALNQLERLARFRDKKRMDV